MRKFLGFALLVCTFPAIAPAQAAAPAQTASSQTGDAGTTAASKEDVLKFMDLMHLRTQLTRYFDGIAKQAKLGAEDGFKLKVPNPTPQQIADVDKFADSLFEGWPIDEMLDAMVPIYQKHLTKEDLDAILAFYSSPVGQKLLREQPAMMQEGMQVGGEIGRRRIGDVGKKMDDFISKMAQDSQHQHPEPKQ
jgi:hypothetical protein